MTNDKRVSAKILKKGKPEHTKNKYQNPRCPLKDLDESKKSDETILVVGNGTSLLDYTNGKEIDAFDVVVRFNNYKLKGFEENVGTKTDIWVTTTCNRVYMESKEYKEVYFHSWVWNKPNDKNYRRILEKMPSLTVFDRSEVVELRELIPQYPSMAFSTGLIAINHLLKKYKQVHLAGFDWWDRKEHHYGDTEGRGTLHHPKLEYGHIMELERKRKVKFFPEKQEKL